MYTYTTIICLVKKKTVCVNLVEDFLMCYETKKVDYLRFMILMMINFIKVSKVVSVAGTTNNIN